MLLKNKRNYYETIYDGPIGRYTIFFVIENRDVSEQRALSNKYGS